ncbi:MAG: 3-oxoacyl-[acyl-carrier-protein] synthase III C-terminal domain-containing protein [Thermodesulfobacteriota bacterium]
MRDGLFQAGQHVLIASFGFGFTWASAAIRWQTASPLKKLLEAVQKFQVQCRQIPEECGVLPVR